MGMEDGTITLDILVDTMRAFEAECMDAEMDLLLKDNGPALLSLLHGGRLFEVNGRYYVISADALKFKWRCAEAVSSARP